LFDDLLDFKAEMIEHLKKKHPNICWMYMIHLDMLYEYQMSKNIDNKKLI